MAQAQEAIRMQWMQEARADADAVAIGRPQKWEWLYDPEKDHLRRMPNSKFITRYYQDSNGMNHDVYGAKGWKHVRPGPELIDIITRQQERDRASEADGETRKKGKR